MTIRNISKRTVDIVGSIIGLTITFPVMIIIAVAIRTKMGRPVLYRQMRPGLKGKPFYLYKFRTMMNLYNKNGEPLSDQERLVGLGRFLRRTSLDELPEFWNVLRGEMSLVGPRPLLMEYLKRYNAQQLRRHDVKPGITGWAQVHGRNALSWEDKFMLDIWYVDHSSFWVDLKILCLTIVKILKKEGISAEGHVTMPEFRGSRNC